MRKSTLKRLSIYCIIVFLSISSNKTFANIYPASLKWQTLDTPNFSVHYPAGFEEYANYAVQRLKIHLEVLSQRYDHHPPHFHVTLNPSLRQNGAHVTILPLRIVVPIQPTMDKGIRPQAGNYLDRVLLHELAHIIQLSNVDGFTKPLKKVFGEGVAPVGISPNWTLEGMAVYDESVGNGGRLNSSYHRMLWVTPIWENKLWDINQMGNPGTVQPPASRAYIGGGYLSKHLVEMKGNANYFGFWIDNMAAIPVLQGRAFHKTFYPLNATNAFWQSRQAWYQQIAGEMEDRENAGLSNSKLLLDSPNTDYRYPKIFGNGILVRESGYERPSRILELNLETGESRVALNGHELGASLHEGFAVLEEGIIYSRLQRDLLADEADKNKFIFVGWDGSSHELEGLNSEGWAPDWNAANERLAYVNVDDAAKQQLCIGTISGDGIALNDRSVLIEAHFGSISDPSWNPDGSKLALTFDAGNGESVLVYDFEYRIFTKIMIQNASCTWDPSFLDNNRLLVSADPDKYFDVFRVDLEERTATRLSRSKFGALEAAQIANGKGIVYSGYSSDGFELNLLQSEDYLNETVDISIQSWSNSEQPITVKSDKVDISVGKYKTFHHVRPLTWSPTIEENDEPLVGGFLYGQDPLLLTSYRFSLLYGIQSQKPSADLSLTLRQFPVHLGLELSTYMDVEYEPLFNADGYHVAWDTTKIFSRHWQGSTTFFKTLYLDHDRWWSYITPRFGYIGREISLWNYTYNPATEVSTPTLHHRRFHGYHGGVSLARYYGSAKDPVISHYQGIDISYEHDLGKNSQVAGEVLNSAIRYHTPLPFTHHVASAQLSMQLQDGDLNYSRRFVLPRGYPTKTLPYRHDLGNLAKLGLGWHFPIAYPDRGALLGFAFLKSISGNVFHEVSTGFGYSRSFGKWIQKNGVYSSGMEVAFNGHLFFSAPVTLSVGGAYRSYFDDFTIFTNFGIPVLEGFYHRAAFDPNNHRVIEGYKIH
ncbi:hypothetical protein K8I28_05965 [bacterium]|nr:hypothetical protein [bacterium]